MKKENLLREIVRLLALAARVLRLIRELLEDLNQF